uniref:histidine kinase n=1 Tax=Geobacter metallireducens TaxID=28232 RepID=A0A831UGJ1_GEOME
MPAILTRNRIGTRLIWKAALLSLLFSVAFSAIHLAIEYNRSLDSLDHTVKILETAHVNTITAALWSFDREQIASQLDEFSQYPFISYAAIESRTAVVSEWGTRGKPGVEVRTVPMAMAYNGRMVPVGNLHLEIDRSSVLQGTLVSAAVTLAFQAVTIAIVVLVALKLFEREVTRHLAAAASYCSSLDITRMNSPLDLDKERRDDELDALVDAFNQMRESLSVAYQQLNQAQKMEAVGRLAGGVAHDYNNKLTVILGYAQLLRQGGVVDDEAREQVGEIIRAAEHSRDITSQLLAFSRSQRVMPVRVDLNRLVERAQKSLGRLIGEEVTLRFSPGRELWSVRMDPTQADQLLMNLVLNARDAIAGHGSVLIATENVVLDAAACGPNPGITPGEYVRLTVSDTGCGMDRETLEHIFEPFFSTKEPGKGTGLGLATVYGIVRQNGGAIQVQSEPGKGSVFSIYFPRFQGGDRVPEPASLPRAAAATGTILVVDDDEAILGITASMLRHGGFTVLAAGGAQEAIDICRRPGMAIDLILTDVIMPDMNAGALIPLVREHQPGVKVLCMSGHPADVIEQRGMIGDDMPFLRKPFSPDVLREKIALLLPADR